MSRKSPSWLHSTRHRCVQWCSVGIWVSLACSTVPFLIFLAPLLCMFLGAFTSYSLTLIMGRLLEASLSIGWPHVLCYSSKGSLEDSSLVVSSRSACTGSCGREKNQTTRGILLPARHGDDRHRSTRSLSSSPCSLLTGLSCSCLSSAVSGTRSLSRVGFTSSSSTIPLSSRRKLERPDARAPAYFFDQRLASMAAICAAVRRRERSLCHYLLLCRWCLRTITFDATREVMEVSVLAGVSWFQQFNLDPGSLV